MKSKIKSQDRYFIQEAANYLENPSYLVRLTDLMGRPIEAALARLPQKARKKMSVVSQASLQKALGYAVKSLRGMSAGSANTHVAMTAASGALGGFFGLVALPIELPVTTIVMLRSIAAIAAENGFDLNDEYVLLDCLSVFSMGAPVASDDHMTSSYFTSRVAMARLIEEGVVAKLIAAISARFEVVLSEKLAAQSLPVLGAMSGALLNSAFTSHFNSIARYHFGLKALEREYGMIQVRDEYMHQNK